MTTTNEMVYKLAAKITTNMPLYLKIHAGVAYSMQTTLMSMLNHDIAVQCGKGEEIQLSVTYSMLNDDIAEIEKYLKDNLR